MLCTDFETETHLLELGIQRDRLLLEIDGTVRENEIVFEKHEDIKTL